MSVLYSVLSTGRSALLTHQQGIAVTGHNIANVNTPGYTRQRLALETNVPVSGQPGQLGTGVNGAEIQRIYDRFVSEQIHSESHNLGQWESYTDSLRRIEKIFEESSGFGFSQVMGEFWNAWQDLVNNPGGQAERVALVAKSETLATTFQQFRQNLVGVQTDADHRIQLAVDEINLLSQQIADLNRKISQAEVIGQNANDYRDKRNLLIGELSLLIDASSFESDDGKVTVILNNGKPLVENFSSWSLVAVPGGTGLHNVEWEDKSGTTTDITGQLTGGKLKGWIDARDVSVTDYLNQLDTLANVLITEINAVHSAGYGLVDPVTALPYTGNDFFSGSDAGDIQVDATVAANFEAVAASATQAGVPGDNSIAIQIAHLQSKLTMNGPPATSTFDEYYYALISGLGSEARGAENYFNYQKDMLEHLNNFQESKAGVSLDEEMVQLIEFQKGYDASARLISIVDEMMESILQMV